MSTHPPRLACLDLDTFFVSVERLLDPSLVGKEVVVGGTGWRGVVTSCSYEVRARGVRSGMPLAEARRLAPDAVYLGGTHGVYSDHSRRVREVLDDYTPDVQAASIDEFFLDFRGCERLYARAGESPDATITRVVKELRVAVWERTGLPASVGLASTRPMAKMASGLAKPAGVLVVPAGGEAAFVRPLPVRKWPGIGPRAEERLVSAGLTTLGDLLDLSDTHPHHRAGEAVRQGAFGGPRALGADRPAFHEHDRPEAADDGREHTLSNERTFFAALDDRERVREVLRGLVERVCHRARRRGVTARVVQLKVRTSDFRTITRSRTLRGPTNHEPAVLQVADELLVAGWSGDLPVRLLGVGLSGLDRGGAQLTLPLGPRTNGAEGPAVGAAIDRVRERFGYDALRFGVARHRSATGAGTWRSGEVTDAPPDRTRADGPPRRRGA